MSELNEIERGQICRMARESLREAEFGLSNFPGLLKKIIENKAWECRHIVSTEGKPRGGVSGGIVRLSSLRELITEKPMRGWGEDPKKIEAVIRDDPEALALYREAMNGALAESRRPTKEEQQNNPDGVRVMQYGNSDAYWQARILRDCPEEMEFLKAGTKRIIDIRRERGWVSSTKRVTLTGKSIDDAARLLAAFGLEYLRNLVSVADGMTTCTHPPTQEETS